MIIFDAQKTNIMEKINDFLFSVREAKVSISYDCGHVVIHVTGGDKDHQEIIKAEDLYRLPKDHLPKRVDALISKILVPVAP